MTKLPNEVQMSSRFTAKCSACGVLMTPGEKILWSAATRKARHQNCATATGQGSAEYNPDTVGAATGVGGGVNTNAALVDAQNTEGKASAIEVTGGTPGGKNENSEEMQGLTVQDESCSFCGSEQGEQHAQNCAELKAEHERQQAEAAAEQAESDEDQQEGDDEEWWNEKQQQQQAGNPPQQQELDPITQALLEKMLAAKTFVTRTEAKKFIKQLRGEMKRAATANRTIQQLVKKAEQEISETLQAAPRRIEVIQPEVDLPPVQFTNVHPMFDTILKLFGARKADGTRYNVYAHGMPGASKSTTGMQVAKALHLHFDIISLTDQTSEYVLLGYNDATGKFVETAFFRCFTQGGVFCLEELDNASANVITVINTAIDNGYCGFPNGTFQRHPDFVLYANGNTNGEGGNVHFPDRRTFDSATKDRFAFVEFEIDPHLEQSLTMGINPNAKDWLKWVRKVRAYCEKNFPRILATPRAAYFGADWLKLGFTYSQVANMSVFKGADKEAKDKILYNCPLPKDQAA